MKRVRDRLPRPNPIRRWLKARISALLRERDLKLAAVFVCGLLILEAILFKSTFFTYFRSFLAPAVMPTTEIAWRLAFIPPVVVLSILIVVAFVRASLIAGPLVRLLSWLLCSIGVLVEYSYQHFTGRFSSTEDIVAALAFLDPARLGDLVSLASPTAVAPILAYGLLLLATTAAGTNRVRPFLITTAGMLLFYSFLFPFSQGTFHTLSLSAFARSVTFAQWDLLLRYHGPRLPVGYQSDARPSNNIVFIIDESVRPDHLSVNGYDRPTTPYLLDLRRQGVLQSWDRAVAGGTCSALSNTLLLTGVTRLPDIADRTKKQPSLFQYAKAMNYRTHYYDGAAQRFWLGEAGDLQFIDDWRSTPVANSNYDTDFALAKAVAGIIRHSKGEFFWINKRGVHFPYYKNFPDWEAEWTPTMASNAPDPNPRDELVNAYDNAIAYNIDRFFSYLLDDSRALENTVIVYTSDHGQTLSEHGESWSHCVGTRNEAIVPIIIVAAPGLDVDTTYPASHHNLFATVLDLMGFPDAKRQYDYSPSLFKARGGAARPRTYLVGSINGRGFSQVVPFD